MGPKLEQVGWQRREESLSQSRHCVDITTGQTVPPRFSSSPEHGRGRLADQSDSNSDILTLVQTGENSIGTVVLQNLYFKFATRAKPSTAATEWTFSHRLPTMSASSTESPLFPTGSAIPSTQRRRSAKASQRCGMWGRNLGFSPHSDCQEKVHFPSWFANKRLRNMHNKLVCSHAALV